MQTHSSSLSLRRVGKGAPLVLLHALGSSSRSWSPVIPALSESFEVITIDLPGFGESPPLDPSVEPSPAALAAAVADALDTAGISRPHVVGNSIGGWVALELGAIRKLASLTLLSPAGMWSRSTPWYCRISLRATRWSTAHFRSTLGRLATYRFGRVLLLGQTHGRPSRVSPEEARHAIDAMGTCPGFAATLRATLRRHYEAPISHRELLPPATVAWGSRDLLIWRRAWRRVDELPTGTAERTLHGCGHLPMSDDPTAVVALIRESVLRGSEFRARANTSYIS